MPRHWPLPLAAALLVLPACTRPNPDLLVGVNDLAIGGATNVAPGGAAAASGSDLAASAPADLATRAPADLATRAPADLATAASCFPDNACAPAGAAVCRGGAWLPSCGDQICDCGETHDSCAQDCPGRCRQGACAYLGGCVVPGSCEPGGVGQWCQRGTFVSSCGDSRCDCGETAESCPEDCG